MVRTDLVQDKVRRLRETLAALRGCLPANPAALAGSRDACDLVSFRVYLAMQEAIDIASHLIADEGWGRHPACASTSRSSRREASSSRVLRIKSVRA